jgi:hypothetical protein
MGFGQPFRQETMTSEPLDFLQVEVRIPLGIAGQFDTVTDTELTELVSGELFLPRRSGQKFGSYGSQVHVEHQGGKDSPGSGQELWIPQPGNQVVLVLFGEQGAAPTL